MVDKKIPGGVEELSSERFQKLVFNIEENDKSYSLVIYIKYKETISISENIYRDTKNQVKCKHCLSKEVMYLVTKNNQDADQTKGSKQYFLLTDNHENLLESTVKNGLTYKCKGYRVRINLIPLDRDYTSDESC